MAHCMAPSYKPPSICPFSMAQNGSSLHSMNKLSNQYGIKNKTNQALHHSNPTQSLFYHKTIGKMFN